MNPEETKIDTGRFTIDIYDALRERQNELTWKRPLDVEEHIELALLMALQGEDKQGEFDFIQPRPWIVKFEELWASVRHRLSISLIRAGLPSIQDVQPEVIEQAWIRIRNICVADQS